MREPAGRPPDLRVVLGSFWKWTTLGIVLCAGLLTAAISLVLPKSYRAEAKILPNMTDQGGSALRSLASAGLEGFLSGGFPTSENPILTYPEIMSSRTVLEKVALSPFPVGSTDPNATILKAIGIRPASALIMVDRGVVRLRDITKVYANPRSGIIIVSAITNDGRLSALIVQRLLDELERFNAITRATQGRAAREFVEARLKEAGVELGTAEQSLSAFRESNIHIGNSPQLQLRQLRLEREVQTRVDIYRLLSQQYESARIEEKRERPSVSIIDPPTAPVRKYRPRVLFNVIVAMICAAGIRFVIVSLLAAGGESSGNSSLRKVG